MNNTDPFENAFRGPAFISYIVAGDPSPQESAEIAKALIDGGADIIELGLPFSDPVGDGPVIQRADTRSLSSGFKTEMIFEIARDIKDYSDLPVVIMAYLNPILAAGVDHFYKTAGDSGVDGILIVDMPLEESDIVADAAKKYDIAQIFMISANTSKKRISEILKVSAGINIRSTDEGEIIKKGFIYLVSSQGVTGTRDLISDRVPEMISGIREISDKLGICLPIAVGFGISNQRQAEDMIRAGADGFIVGSAIVKLVEEYSGDINIQRAKVREFARDIRGLSGKGSEGSGGML